MQFRKAFQEIISKQHRKAGTRAYYKNGEVYFSRLYGYQLINGKYEPDQKYSEHIRSIITMLSAGKTLPEIKKMLDSNMKARDSSNNRYCISKIISVVRPVYCGYIQQHGRYIKISNIVPLVSLEIYQRAKKQLSMEKKNIISS